MRTGNVIRGAVIGLGLLAGVLAAVAAGCSRGGVSAAVANTYEETGAAARRMAQVPQSMNFYPSYIVAERDGAGVFDGVSLAPGEELWVIVPPGGDLGVDRAPGPVAGEDVPGCGGLMCQPPEAGDDAEPVDVAVPLEHTDVRASILGYVASVTVRQRFHNPYDGKIEAEYVFPLPHDAAVNGFVMTIGERRIRGVIREREEAEAVYRAARAQGYAASLLTQARPNVFTQRVANIEPGQRIDVEITYFHTLRAPDGWFEWVFPMVVGPRYNPASSGGGGVGASARGRPGSSGQGVEVQYLRPNERSGHDVSVEVEIASATPIEAAACVSHAATIESAGPSRRTVRLDPADSIPNRDFVVRFRPAPDRASSGLVLQPAGDGSGGWFTLMLTPPVELTGLERRPVEFVFVLDTSGSMRGKPLAIAQRSVAACLDLLTPADSFRVLRFSDRAASLGAGAASATRANVRAAKRELMGLRAGGGTEMVSGIRAALTGQEDDGRQRFVVFMTDGFIGNEDEVLRALHEGLGGARVFSFGIGSSPNRFLLERMARMGRGAAAYVGLSSRADRVMEVFFERAAHPVLTDLEVDGGGLRAAEVYPATVPDLLVGRPVVLTGRYEGDAAGGWGPIVVRGRTPAGVMGFEVDPGAAARGGDAAGLDAVWARARIADLMDGVRRGEASPAWTAGEVERLALAHGLASAYTSFVAVDSSRRTAGESGTTVGVPVPVPAGVRYDTTVPGG